SIQRVQSTTRLTNIQIVFHHSIYMLYDPYAPVFSTPTIIPTTTRKMSEPISPAAAKAAADEAFEREKAAIISYEDGWDRWDGPVWPIGYVQCRMQADDYVQPAAVRNTDESGNKIPESE
ncbi:hypothetical protein JQN64_28330, partial [Escherichia coli]|nr:hypothetical protein [Escherichia coli]